MTDLTALREQLKPIFWDVYDPDSDTEGNVQAALDKAMPVIALAAVSETTPSEPQWRCGKCDREEALGYDDFQIGEHHRTCPKRNMPAPSEPTILNDGTKLHELPNGHIAVRTTPAPSEAHIVRRNEWQDGSYQEVYSDGSSGPVVAPTPSEGEREAAIARIRAKLDRIPDSDAVTLDKADVRAVLTPPAPEVPTDSPESRSTAAKVQPELDAPVDREKLEDQVADTLAYYQCRKTNPKADHPRMGYHAFSEEQREHLKAQKAEAAAEIVRMMLAVSTAPACDEWEYGLTWIPDGAGIPESYTGCETEAGAWETGRKLAAPGQVPQVWKRLMRPATHAVPAGPWLPVAEEERDD